MPTYTKTLPTLGHDEVNFVESLHNSKTWRSLAVTVQEVANTEGWTFTVETSVPCRWFLFVDESHIGNRLVNRNSLPVDLNDSPLVSFLLGGQTVDHIELTIRKPAGSKLNLFFQTGRDHSHIWYRQVVSHTAAAAAA
jgi:hypothetical protein